MQNNKEKLLDKNFNNDAKAKIIIDDPKVINQLLKAEKQEIFSKILEDSTLYLEIQMDVLTIALKDKDYLKVEDKEKILKNILEAASIPHAIKINMLKNILGEASITNDMKINMLSTFKDIITLSNGEKLSSLMNNDQVKDKLILKQNPLQKIVGFTKRLFGNQESKNRQKIRTFVIKLEKERQEKGSGKQNSLSK
jgi:hypothetical protein